MTDDTITIEKATCTAETSKAILVAFDDRVLWIPKSVVHDNSEVWAQDTTGDLVVARWWAEKEGVEP